MVKRKSTRGKEISHAVERRIAALPEELRGKVTLERAKEVLEREGVEVSISTIQRVWRRYGVSPRPAPKFDGRNDLIKILARTHPGDLGLEHDHWTLSRFRDYLQFVGLVEDVSRRTVARFLDDAGITRPSELWPGRPIGARGN